MIEPSPTEHHQRNNLTFFVGSGCLAVALLLFVFLQMAPILGKTPQGTPRSNQNDFKHVYLGALLLSEGESPYDRQLIYTLALAEAQSDPRFVSYDSQGHAVPRVLPFVYLPFTGVVFIPFTWLSFHQAAQLFILLNGLLLILGLGLLAKAEGMKLTPTTVALCALPVLLNFCVFRSNTAGQLNAVLFFGAALLYWQLSWRRLPWLSGLIAALLMLFKITPGIFLIWFLLSRRWAEAAWMLGIALGITLLIALVFGFDTHLQFLPLLADMGFGKSTWSDVGYTFWRDPFNQSLNSFFHHILVPGYGLKPWVESTPTLANALTWACALGILASFGASIWFKQRPAAASTEAAKGISAPFSPQERLGFALAVLVSLLAPSIMWDHYLIQALLPALVIWSVSAHLRPTQKRVARGAVLCFWVVSSLGFDAGSGTLHTGILGVAGLIHANVQLPGAGGPLGLIWMSLKLWPTLLLFFAGLILHFSRALEPRSENDFLEANKNTADDT